MLTLVEVIWTDAFIEGQWSEYTKPTLEDSLVSTYGLLVNKDKKWVTLAMTYCAGSAPYWGALWHIPRGNVSSIREIEQVPDKPHIKSEVSKHEHPIEP